LSLARNPSQRSFQPSHLGFAAFDHLLAPNQVAQANHTSGEENSTPTSRPPLTYPRPDSSRYGAGKACERHFNACFHDIITAKRLILKRLWFGPQQPSRVMIVVHGLRTAVLLIIEALPMEGCGALRDCRHLLHDRDTKYTQSFRAIIASGQVEPLVLPARSPKLRSLRWSPEPSSGHSLPICLLEQPAALSTVSASSRLEPSMRLRALALMLLTTFALVRGPFARACIGERE
jgi:hypothetical protein